MQGEVFKYIENLLSDYTFFKDYRQENISREEYLTELNNHKASIRDKGLSAYHYQLARRLPTNDSIATVEILEKLQQKGVIPTKEYNRVKYRKFRQKVTNEFGHASYSTCIFPEEARAAFALADIIEPDTVFVAGSYYGFWAIWTLPAVKDAKGKAILSDVDPDVSSLSQKNIEKMAFSKCVDVECQDAEKLLKESSATIDLMLLDAYGNINDSRPEYRGKAIYNPLAETAMSRLQAGSILLVHNVDRSATELTHFFKLVDNEFDIKIEIATTCGIGVYVK